MLLIAVSFTTSSVTPIAVWGDTGLGDNVPTSVLLQAGSNTPVFTYVTPGSNFGLDVVVGEQVRIKAYFSLIPWHHSTTPHSIFFDT